MDWKEIAGISDQFYAPVTGAGTGRHKDLRAHGTPHTEND